MNLLEISTQLQIVQAAALIAGDVNHSACAEAVYWDNFSINFKENKLIILGEVKTKDFLSLRGIAVTYSLDFEES